MEKLEFSKDQQRSELQRILEQLPSGAQKLQLLAQFLTSQQVKQEAVPQQPSDAADPLYAGTAQQPWPAAAAGANEQQEAAAAAADPSYLDSGPERAVAALLQRLSSVRTQQQQQQQEIEQQPEVQSLLESLAAARAARQQQQQQGDAGAQARPSTGSLGIPSKQQQQAQQQQQQLTSKLRMKPGKHLAAAAAREARQSGAAAASIAQWRRKPLNLSAAKAPAPGLIRPGGSVVSPGRDTLARTASSFSQQQQQQQHLPSPAAGEAPWLDPAAAAAMPYMTDQLSPGLPAAQWSDSVLSGSQRPYADPGASSSRRISAAGPQISQQATYQQQDLYQPDIPQSFRQSGEPHKQTMVSEGSDLGVLQPTVMTSTTSDRGVTGLEMLVDAAAAVLAPEEPTVNQQQQRLQQLQQRLAAVRAQFLRQQQQQTAAVDPSSVQLQQQQQGSSIGLGGVPQGRQRLRNLEANLSTLMSELQSLLPQIQRARAPVPRFDAAAAGSSMGRALTPPAAAGGGMSYPQQQQQQQQHAAAPAYSGSTGLLSAAEQSPPPLQQQQYNETWQGIYQPEPLAQAPVNPDSSTLLAGSAGLAQPQTLGQQNLGGLGVTSPNNTPTGVSNSFVAASRSSLPSSSKASQNAQQLQHMLEEVKQLSNLPGVGPSDTANELPEDSALQILSQPLPLNMAIFRKTLAEILAAHKEAKELLQAAVNLGLLPAPKSQQQQQQSQELRVLPDIKAAAATAAAAEALDAAAADSLDQEPPAKRHRSDQSIGAPMTPAAAAAAAAAAAPDVAAWEGSADAKGGTAAAEEAEMAAAAAGLSALGGSGAAENAQTGEEQVAQQVMDVAAQADKLPAGRSGTAGSEQGTKQAPGVKQPAEQPTDVASTQQQQQQQQGIGEDLPASTAAAAAAEGGEIADALTDLAHRIALVLFKMQRHVRGLAFLAVPCAAEVLSVRQSAAAIMKQILPDLQPDSAAAASITGMASNPQQGVNNSLDVVKSAITDLQQQLSTERAAAAAHQQDVEQLEQQLAAVTQQQRQQARLVASAVTQLMGAVNSTAGLTDSDRMTLVAAGAELLQSML